MALGLDLHHQLSWGSGLRVHPADGGLATPHDYVRQFRMRNLCLYMSSWPFLRRTLIDVACPAETGSSAQVDRLPVKGPYRSTAYFLLGTPLPETRPPACVGASPRALGRHLVAERGDALAPSPGLADPVFADPRRPRLRRPRLRRPANVRSTRSSLALLAPTRWRTRRRSRRRAARRAPPPPRGSQSGSGIERKQTIVVTRARGRVTRTNAQPRRERGGLRTRPL